MEALRLKDAAPLLFRYCAENLAEKPGIADAMALNDACPAEYLIQVAPFLKEAVNLRFIQTIKKSPWYYSRGGLNGKMGEL